MLKKAVPIFLDSFLLASWLDPQTEHHHSTYVLWCLSDSIHNTEKPGMNFNHMHLYSTLCCSDAFPVRLEPAENVTLVYGVPEWGERHCQVRSPSLLPQRTFTVPQGCRGRHSGHGTQSLLILSMPVTVEPHFRRQWMWVGSEGTDGHLPFRASISFLASKVSNDIHREVWKAALDVQPWEVCCLRWSLVLRPSGTRTSGLSWYLVHLRFTVLRNYISVKRHLLSNAQRQITGAMIN